MTEASSTAPSHKQRDKFTFLAKFLEPLQIIKSPKQQRQYLQALFNYALYQIDPGENTPERVKGLFWIYCREELRRDWLKHETETKDPQQNHDNEQANRI